MNIVDKIHTVKTKEDFLEFLRMLIEDLKSNDWDNSSLEQYLWGIEGWVDDMDGYFLNMKDHEILSKINRNELDWKILAHILFAATAYE